jgi:hypothetical protein
VLGLVFREKPRARTAALPRLRRGNNACMTDRYDEDFDWHAVDQMGLWESIRVDL